MAMKICKECGTEISKSAKACPKCGKKQNNMLLRFLLGFVLIMIGVGMLSGGDTNNINNSTQTSTSVNETIVTRENYDKINKGMTESEVQTILGEPESISESETPGVGTMILKHYQEAFSLKAIDIYFLDGKVYMKNWTQL